MADEKEVVVKVDVGTVDNVVPIADLLPKIAEGLTEELKRAEADPKVPPEAEARIRAAANHARLLAREVRQTKTMVPKFQLLERSRRPGRPGPEGPAGSGRPRTP